MWLGLGLALASVGAAAQTVTGSGTTGTVAVFTGSSTVGSTTTPITVTSAGNVGIGTTAPGANLDIESPTGNATFILSSQSNYTAAWLYSFNNVGWEGNFWSSRRARGTGSSPVAVQHGDMIGAFDLWGYDGSSWTRTAQIMGVVDGTPSAGIIPSQIFFNLTNNSGSMFTPFLINSTGNVGIGTTNPGATLEVNGNVKLTSGSGASITFPDNTVQSTAWTGALGGGDYAESVDTSGDRTGYGAGDLLVIDKHDPSKFAKSSEPYSTMVAGIYSTKPGAVGRRQTTPKSTDEIPMAVVGIVPAKVSAENGVIEAGDLLVSSSTPGAAMKGTDRSRMLGAVVGKAMGTLNSGTGVIEVLVTLQ
jgi:hypothetical protein